MRVGGEDIDPHLVIGRRVPFSFLAQERERGARRFAAGIRRTALNAVPPSARHRYKWPPPSGRTSCRPGRETISVLRQISTRMLDKWTPARGSVLSEDSDTCIFQFRGLRLATPDDGRASLGSPPTHHAQSSLLKLGLHPRMTRSATRGERIIEPTDRGPPSTWRVPARDSCMGAHYGVRRTIGGRGVGRPDKSYAGPGPRERRQACGYRVLITGKVGGGPQYPAHRTHRDALSVLQTRPRLRPASGGRNRGSRRLRTNRRASGTPPR